MNEDAMMQRVAGGDSRAFEYIVRGHQQSLLLFAIRLLGNVDDARDAVQDAFLNLWRSREAYRPCGKLRPYLYRLVHNACIDQRSRHRSTFDLDDVAGLADTTAVAETAEHSQLADAVREAVTSLPADQRVVFVLSCYGGMTYSEIAEIVGCPVGTVASRKRLAAHTLRKRLASWED